MSTQVSPRFLASPRRRRRLARAGLVLTALGATLAVFLLLPGPPPAPPERFSNQPADLYVAARPLKVDRAARAAIGATIEQFVQDGLGRRDLANAYRLATPQLRAGISREDWRRGELPVMPYRARVGDGRLWTKDYASGDVVGIEIFLHPGRGETMGPIAFKAAVRRLDGRWLVDSVVPAATFSPVDQKPRVFANVDFQRGDLGSGAAEGRLDAAWLLLPAGLLAACVLVPLLVLGYRFTKGA